jgi:hypothetical protein
MREEDAKKAIYQKTHRRQEGKEAFNIRYKIRAKPLKEGDIILYYNLVREVDMSLYKKLDFRWLGPY